MIDKTDITILLDRSGSMSLVKSATIDGFNAFIYEQRKLGKPSQVTLYQFNDVTSLTYSADLDVVQFLTNTTFNTGGSTALYDAIKRAIDDTGHRLSSIAEYQRPDKVIMVVVTDGEENCSLTTLSTINEMIRHQKEKYNWDFVFIGINELGEKTTNHFARTVGTGNIQPQSVRTNAGATPEEHTSGSFKMLSEKMSEYRTVKKTNFYA